jgi:hypothetical protein
MALWKRLRRTMRTGERRPKVRPLREMGVRGMEVE